MMVSPNHILVTGEDRISTSAPIASMATNKWARVIRPSGMGFCHQRFLTEARECLSTFLSHFRTTLAQMCDSD
jgi:hypothetical protein